MDNPQTYQVTQFTLVYGWKHQNSAPFHLLLKYERFLQLLLAKIKSALSI